jgi:hypothetical protein
VGVKLGHRLREKYKLGIFENRALRNIFGRKREDVTEGRRKLHHEQLHGLLALPNIIQEG